MMCEKYAMWEKIAQSVCKNYTESVNIYKLQVYNSMKCEIFLRSVCVCV